MKSSWSRYSTVVMVGVLTAIALVCWLSLLLCLWLLLRVVGVETDFWAMTSALSTAVAAAAVLGAGLVAHRELTEVASSRHLDVANRLFEELNSPENIEARRWVFQNLPDDPEGGMRALSPEGRSAAKRVLNSLDRVAFLTQRGWIPEEMIMEWMNPMVVKSWLKLGPYVDYESRRRNEPDYYGYARHLAERCLIWRSENLPEAEITWVDGAL